MPDIADEIFTTFTQPTKLWTRGEVLRRPCPVPKKAGIYAWYFKDVPSGVLTDGCYSSFGSYLLYVGISPGGPPKEGKQNRQTICARIRTHYRGNADSSTLRFTLGCLLGEKLGIVLAPHGIRDRLMFGAGEEILSDWMDANAFVVWYAVERPWTVEHEIIRRLNVPLNLEGNQNHPFHPILSAIRRKCKQAARSRDNSESVK